LALLSQTSIAPALQQPLLSMVNPANRLIRDHRNREIPAKHVENGGHRELHFCAPMFKARVGPLQVLLGSPLERSKSLEVVRQHTMSVELLPMTRHFTDICAHRDLGIQSEG
jgi:hypothetical protein